MIQFKDLMMVAFKEEQVATSFKRMSPDGHNITIGASVACPLREYLDRTRGAWPVTFEQFIAMRKGNVTEGVFEGNLDFLKILFERQGNYYGVGLYSFMEVHPDLLINLYDQPDVTSKDGLEFIQELKDEGFKYALIELKTSNTIPKEAHSYWVKQVNVQSL